MDETTLILQEQRVLTPSSRWFRFVTEGGEPLQWQPGQFYRLGLTDEQGRFERSYSIANFQEHLDASVLDLLIAPVENGRATRWFWSARNGTSIHARGPYGKLLLPEPLPRRLLLVATSVGLAPYLPILNELRRRNTATRVELVLGFGSREDFFYRSELGSLNDHWEDFRLHLAYSRGLPASPAACEHAGRVQQVLFSDLLDPLKPEEDRIYLCGNPEMIDDSFSSLKKRGFKGRQVIREKYVFARDDLSVKQSPTLSAEQKRLVQESLRKLRS